MTYKKSGKLILFFLMVFTEVTPWTIDLPQVRKYFFEKHEREMHKSSHEYENYLNRDQVFFSNAQGNSLHNSKDNELHKKKDKYAEEFGYESYMEKKVKDIIHEGGAYLEGLRRSLEEFNSFLEGCNRRNASMIQVPIPSTTMPSLPNSLNIPLNPSNITTFNTTNWSTLNNTNWSISNNTEPLISNNTNWSRMTLELNTTGSKMSCKQATEASERVRRYAELAMWATRRLQDLEYADKYQHTDKYEENELILKLAWFLDKLALLTGYEPHQQPYIPPLTTETPTTSPTPMTLVPQNDELRDYMINCIKANSSVPATIRCQYPLPLPDLVQQIVGGTSTPVAPSTSDVVPLPPTDSNPEQSMEILIAADDFRTPRRLSKRSPIPDEYYVPIPVHEKPKPVVDFIVKKLTNLKDIVKTVKKHAVADFATQLAIHKHIHKRSVDDNSTLLSNQLSNTSKPYVKTDSPTIKVPSIHLPILDVSVINTKSFKKRSIENKNLKSYFLNKLLNDKTTVKSVKKRSIDNPLFNLANYFIKYKIWDSSNPEYGQNDKKPLDYDLNNNLHQKTLAKRSLFHSKNRHLLPQIIKEKTSYKYKNLPKKEKNTKLRNIYEKKAKNIKKKLHKVSKRSLTYEHMYVPRIPINPVGDISYYVKNKDGRIYAPSLTQAAQVRLGLEQVFQTGNIAVIHRYGSNYNPAVPSPFYVGFIKSLADS